ncbi:MAG: hypothetical protein K8T91_05645 [Planctomycetes bacterium]|nr:hypothetical protein [Planctomycetota bacterium]
MKRLTLMLGIVLLVSAASTAQAHVLTPLERWLGIHYGQGIHAKNGCGPNQGYVGYGTEAYPEEVAPGISEVDELKSSRRPTQTRTTRSPQSNSTQRPSTR